MEVHRKQRYVTELLYAEKMILVDILQQLLNFDGYQTVDVNGERQWVAYFNNDDSVLSPLVQIFLSTSCRLLFIISENA